LKSYLTYIFTFFFQAEDGIRDRNVTGVQTCALPIILVPSVDKVAIATTATNAKIKPYSLNDWPSSSYQKFCSVCLNCMFNSSLISKFQISDYPKRLPMPLANPLAAFPTALAALPTALVVAL